MEQYICLSALPDHSTQTTHIACRICRQLFNPPGQALSLLKQQLGKSVTCILNRANQLKPCMELNLPPSLFCELIQMGSFQDVDCLCVVYRGLGIRKILGKVIQCCEISS